MIINSYADNGKTPVKEESAHFTADFVRLSSAVMKIALIVLSSLVLANISSTLSIQMSMAGSGVLCILDVVNKAAGDPHITETCVRIACLAIAILGVFKVLSPLQTGSMLIGMLAVGYILNCFKKDDVEKCHVYPDKNGKDLLDESTFSPRIPLASTRIVDACSGLGKDIAFATKYILSSLSHGKNYSTSITDVTNSRGLCVFIHGLKGQPAIFDSYYDTLMRENAKITLFQPHVMRKGVSSLEKAGENILNETRKWSQNNPGKPIVFVGVSNGARITGYVATRLASEGIQNPMQAHCIAGPFLGTKLINQPDLPLPLRSFWGKVVKKLYCEEVYRELSWESDTGKKLVRDMQSSASKVHYSFYATFSDSQIRPFFSSFPNLEGADYYCTLSEGHQSIVRAVKNTVILKALQFFAPIH